jgi:hypothetical protein
MDKPKTSALMALLAKLALGDTKTLILTAGSKPTVYLSSRNVPHIEVLPFTDATAYDILRADALVIESAALGIADTTDDGTTAHAARSHHAKPVRVKKATAKAKAKPARAAKKAKAAKPKAAKKAAAKKPAKKKGSK